MAERDQLSLVEALVSHKVGRNETLDRLARDVKWYRFEKLLARLRPDGPGRPPYDPMLMLKICCVARFCCWMKVALLVVSVVCVA